MKKLFLLSFVFFSLFTLPSWGEIILYEDLVYKPRDKNEVVKHTFTHFDLKLKVMHITANLEQVPKRGKFLKPDDFDPNNLPTVMKKVWQSIKY